MRIRRKKHYLSLKEAHFAQAKRTRQTQDVQLCVVDATHVGTPVTVLETGSKQTSAWWLAGLGSTPALPLWLAGIEAKAVYPALAGRLNNNITISPPQIQIFFK